METSISIFNPVKEKEIKNNSNMSTPFTGIVSKYINVDTL